jgi:hypothetical protein
MTSMGFRGRSAEERSRVVVTKHERGVGTILRVETGASGRWGSSFRYRVRLADGSEWRATLPEAFAPGTRLRLLCARGTAGHVRVLAYEPCPAECAP